MLAVSHVLLLVCLATRGIYLLALPSRSVVAIRHLLLRLSTLESLTAWSEGRSRSVRCEGWSVGVRSEGLSGRVRSEGGSRRVHLRLPLLLAIGSLLLRGICHLLLKTLWLQKSALLLRRLRCTS